MQIADPVPEELQGSQPRPIGAAWSRHDLEVGAYRGEEAPGPLWTLIDRERDEVSRDVDVVLGLPLLGVIRPGARVGEDLELRVLMDEPDNLGSRPVGQLLKGNLANDLVADVTPGPGGARRRQHNEQTRQGDQQRRRARYRRSFSSQSMTARGSGSTLF